MKTAKLIFALSLALIFAAGASSMYAQNLSLQDIPVEKAKMIAYVVRIENLPNIMSSDVHYLIMMTNEMGRPVAPPQSFRRGVWDYTFYEGGTVRGARVARMIQAPSTPHSPIIPPTVKTGIFYGGASYLFIIKPVPAVSDTEAVVE
ncbi:MAG: hypothetical protein Q8M08_11890 [Bacteroidales bacterium]|nr:hypothetical protein [Bacteroidales bacterium]